MPKSRRTSILRRLEPIASTLATTQLDTFASRLADTLMMHADQSLRPAEALSYLDAFNALTKNNAQFCEGATRLISQSLQNEIAALEKQVKSKTTEFDDAPMTIDSPDEIEDRILITNLSEAMALEQADALLALHTRIAYLLPGKEIEPEANPFRPELFVQAVFAAWREFDPAVESRRMVFRLMEPTSFLQLKPIYQALNDALIEKGILVDLVEGNEDKSGHGAVSKLSIAQRESNDKIMAERREQAHQAKLRQMLSDDVNDLNYRGHLSVPNLFPTDFAEVETDGDESVPANAGLLSHLSQLQKQVQLNLENGDSGGGADALNLAQIKSQIPDGMLTAADSNTIGLMAKVFDCIFTDDDIAPEIQSLLAPMQIPVLKAALLNQAFFFSDEHPARRLLETLVTVSIGWDRTQGRQDPLFQAIKNCVDRVLREFEQQVNFFSEVFAELESFLADEENLSEIALTGPIAAALQQEKMLQAEEWAKSDVAVRIETGEVAGFVENFLEQQWVKILTLAHSVKDDQPSKLENALEIMDDLIWSMKPKSNAQERKELLAKLPSLLSLVNAWLNMINWEGADRSQFFTRLAERHASTVRASLSPRGQIEFAVNVAQKASERRLSRRAKGNKPSAAEEFLTQVERMRLGVWVTFESESGAKSTAKLVWVSPRRKLFLFTNRLGQGAVAITTTALAQQLLDNRAYHVSRVPVVERAVAEMLDDVDLAQP
ncbi:MAG: DUF1631 family protein [Pseudomonadota bacterium]